MSALDQADRKAEDPLLALMQVSIKNSIPNAITIQISLPRPLDVRKQLLKQ